MTVDADTKVTYKEIFTTVFLKTLPSVLLLVLLAEAVSYFCNSQEIKIPDYLFNLVFAFFLIFVIKLTAGSMISRLLDEKDKE